MRVSVALLSLLASCATTSAFAPTASALRSSSLRRVESSEEAVTADPAVSAEPAADVPSDDEVSDALKDKMMSWEATEEERKAATLGGLTPTSSGVDGFDLGLYIAFPFLFGSLCLFLFFPLIGSRRRCPRERRRASVDAPVPSQITSTSRPSGPRPCPERLRPAGRGGGGLQPPRACVFLR